MFGGRNAGFVQGNAIPAAIFANIQRVVGQFYEIFHIVDVLRMQWITGHTNRNCNVRESVAHGDRVSFDVFSNQFADLKTPLRAGFG